MFTVRFYPWMGFSSTTSAVCFADTEFIGNARSGVVNLLRLIPSSGKRVCSTGPPCLLGAVVKFLMPTDSAAVESC